MIIIKLNIPENVDVPFIDLDPHFMIFLNQQQANLYLMKITHD